MHLNLVLICSVCASLFLTHSNASTNESFSRRLFYLLHKSMTDDELCVFKVRSKHYRCDGELGRGCFGKVLKYVNRLDEEDVVAVKRVVIRNKNDAEWQSDLINEVKCLRLLNHDNIIRFKSAYWEPCQGVPVMMIVTEYLNYGSLDDYEFGNLKGNKMPVDQILSITRDILRALQYCHSYGIIHRDIKPANIMLTKGYNSKTVTAKLIDFGFCTPPTLTKRHDRHWSRSVIGSPLFIAPEIFMGRRYSNKADIWSLGISVWTVYAQPYGDPNTFKSDWAFYEAVEGNRGPWEGYERLPEEIRDFVDSAVVFEAEERGGAKYLLALLERKKWA